MLPSYICSKMKGKCLLEPKKWPTSSPQGQTLLLQGQTHARVAVGLAACTCCSVHQIEISGTRLCLPVAVLWQVAGSRGSAAQHTGALQLDGAMKRRGGLLGNTITTIYCRVKEFQCSFIVNTLQLSQQMPWAHSAPAFRVQLLALQQGLVHSYTKEWVVSPGKNLQDE